MKQKINNFLKNKIEILIIFIVSIIFLFIFSAYVPFNVDEFCHHGALSYYYYPLNMLNTFREGSKEFYLAPFSKFYLPLRSYFYEGIVPCIIYYPLFRLWPSPYSARLLGLIILAIQAFFINRLFKIDILISFILLLFCMPYAFQHIVDTGPLALQTTSVFFICYLARQWIMSFKKSFKYGWTYPFFIGIILFLGIWTKLAYIFILPSIIFLIFYHIVINGKIFKSHSNSKTLMQHLVALFAAATIPSFILLNSKQPDGSKYFKWIIGSKTISILRVNKWLGKVKVIVAYFANPLKAAHRIFILKNKITIEGVLLCSIIIVLLFFGIKLLRARKEKVNFIVLNISLFFLTLFLMSKSSKVWAMHHTVLSFPFLILALFYIYSRLYKNKIVLLLLILFIIVNFSLYFNLTRLEHNDYDHPSKLKINKLLNEKFTDRYVFIVIDWGMYHIKALYGNKNQCVLYLAPLKDIEQIAEVKKILVKIKRKALLIGRVDSDSNLQLINKEFPDLVQLQTDFDTGKWRVWYEK